MTKIVPLVLLLLAGISCKKDKKKDTPPSGISGTFTGKQVVGIVEAEYLGCGPGWSVVIQSSPRVTIIALNLPNNYKVKNKRISFKVGNRIVKDCEMYSSHLGERCEVSNVRAN